MRTRTLHVVFIGSNPSVKSNTFNAFDPSTKSGQTLRKWIDDLPYESNTFMNVSTQMKMNNKPLSHMEIVDSLNLLKLRIDIERSLLPSTADMKLVAVGKIASKALTLLHLPFFELPHPSGRNRKLNDQNHIAEKINGLRDYLNPSM